MQGYTREIEQVMPSFVIKSNLERALDRQNSVLRYQQILYNYRVIDKIISILLDYFIFDSRYIVIFNNRNHQDESHSDRLMIRKKFLQYSHYD